MDDLKQQKLEALAMAAEYTDKVIPAMEEVSAELLGELKDDTVDFLNQIIDAFNFVVEIFNATRDMVNANQELIVEDALEKEINSLSSALKKKDYPEVGKILQGGVLDFVKVFNLKAKELIA